MAFVFTCKSLIQLADTVFISCASCLVSDHALGHMKVNGIILNSICETVTEIFVYV